VAGGDGGVGAGAAGRPLDATKVGDVCTGELVNIDYALAVLVHALRLPGGSELALFAMARSVGWIAHASEQLQHGKLIRPRARYVGPAPGRRAGVADSKG